jgi:hypothetical protein
MYSLRFEILVTVNFFATLTIHLIQKIVQLQFILFMYFKFDLLFYMFVIIF